MPLVAPVMTTVLLMDAPLRVGVALAPGSSGGKALTCRKLLISEDLLDDVHGPAPADPAAPDREEPVQERVLRRRGLEPRQRPEVGRRRIAGICAPGRGRLVGRVVAETLEGHVDQRPVVGLERDAQVELEDT